MTTPQNIRFNLNAPFPTLVTGSGLATVGKQNGIWNVGFNSANLAVQNPPQPASLATDYILVYDSLAKQYVNVPLSTVASPMLLNKLIANNSVNLEDTTSITAAFQDYIIVFDHFLPDTINVRIGIQVQSSGVFQTTGYLNSAGGITTYIDVIQASTLSNTFGWGYSGVLRLFDPNNAAYAKIITGAGSYLNGTLATVTMGGTRNSGLPVTGLRFFMSSGNITQGTVKIYGTA